MGGVQVLGLDIIFDEEFRPFVLEGKVRCRSWILQSKRSSCVKLFCVRIPYPTELPLEGAPRGVNWAMMCFPMSPFRWMTTESLCAPPSPCWNRCRIDLGSARRCELLTSIDTLL